MKVSTPSRICLFGEHQDYLGLEVIALAIDLRFSAAFTPRDDMCINIAIRDSKLDALNADNAQGVYERHSIDLTKPILYTGERDYLLSTVNVLLRQGYPLRGLDIRMDSDIPIGKGMCSSSAMIVALIKALLESVDAADKDDAKRIAWLGYAAEVLEFREPGGMMDHLTSAIGGIIHMNFGGEWVAVAPIDHTIEGCFILFDSLQQKDTTRVLAESKTPTLEAIALLRDDGISSVRDFYGSPEKLSLLEKLPAFQRRKLTANIENYRILQDALGAFRTDMTPERLGSLLNEHQDNLRDGLGISTPAVDAILATAMEHGALGGKINGSGGGGCCYAYARTADTDAIISAVNALGYPAKLLRQDVGIRVDNN